MGKDVSPRFGPPLFSGGLGLIFSPCSAKLIYQSELLRKTFQDNLLSLRRRKCLNLLPQSYGCTAVIQIIVFMHLGLRLEYQKLSACIALVPSIATCQASLFYTICLIYLTMNLVKCWQHTRAIVFIKLEHCCINPLLHYSTFCYGLLYSSHKISQQNGLSYIDGLEKNVGITSVLQAVIPQSHTRASIKRQT